MGSNGGCMLVDADGTRHGYTGSVTNGTNSMYFTGRTADGSFIDYGCSFNYGNYGSGWSKLPNGTSITYSSITPIEGHLHPTLITDAQGNFISITYRNASGNALIETVTDTMGRIITFHYDASNRLLEVRAPRMNDDDSQTTRTVVRLHYRPLTLNYSFAGGITPVVRQSTVQVIDAIYYPGTKTGYWFGDADSYSTYGMITKVVEQRGMDWQTSAEEQGTVIAGDMTKQADYNYPLTTTNSSGRTNGVGLTDAPTYTKLEESWAGRDVQENAITTYSINENVTRWDGFNPAPARLITVTQPSGVISKQWSYKLPPGNWNDGLVFNDETVVMNGSTPTVISSSLVAWQQGNYDSPRPYWAKIWDEKGDEIRTEYTYGTNKFNQITKSCDFDDANVKLRCATAEYENSPNYIGSFNASGKFVGGRHIFNLVKKSAVENPDGTKASLTEYEYDNYTSNPLVNTPGVIQHQQSHNPFNTGTFPCNCYWSCFPEGATGLSPEEGSNLEPEECPDGGPPIYHICDTCYVYDASTARRGNITKVTTYADAQAQTGPIYESRTYDITGNLVANSAACCEQKSYAESTVQNNNKRFTSYDRSNATGLDYAINRTYDSKQGRFTQVDPIGMQAVDLNKPQTLNLYSYCGNDPVNHVDPSGLFFGKLFKWLWKAIKKALKWIAVAISVAIAVITIVYAPIFFATSLKLIFGIIGAVANAASQVLSAFGLNRAGAVFGIIAGFASFGTSFLAARSALNWKTLLSAVSSAATAASRTLSAFGYRRLGQIFGLVSTVTGFISGGLKPKTGGFKWDPSGWETYKFVRSSAEQVASIAGADKVAGYLNVLGVIDDVWDLYKTARMTQQAILQAIVGPDEIYKLDFWNNTKRLLSGQEEDNARFYGYIVPGILRIYGQQFNRVNSIIRRVERGVALAR